MSGNHFYCNRIDGTGLNQLVCGILYTVYEDYVHGFLSVYEIMGKYSNMWVYMRIYGNLWEFGKFIRINRFMDFFGFELGYGNMAID